ncbi:hypothetical protein EIP86_000426 [Pleurotus ostreatoroseus]|nr:hypothetical protein EIP86_000426 [Pleurotus ostreatoroseus]
MAHRYILALSNSRNPSLHYLLVNTWFIFSAASLVDARQHDIPRPVDPYASPQTDPYNPLKYITTNSLTAIGLSLVLAIALPQTWMTWKIGGKFMLAMVIAEYSYQGHLTTTEKYFYLLDLLPLLVALVIYIPFWPGRYIPNTLPIPNAEDDGINAGEKLGEGTLTELEGRPSKASE